MDYIKVLTNEAQNANSFIKKTITDMSHEFDFYIQKNNEVPWWYNERAVLGFYISGLLRDKKNFALQEYSCDRGKDAKSSGRADLLFSYKGRNYLTEAKIGWTSIKTNKTWAEAKQWAKEGLNQAREYYHNEKKIRGQDIFALCFEVIYCTNKDYTANYPALLRDWQDGKKALKHLHFYALIGLRDNNHDGIEFKYENYYYPAIAVYGLFNR